MVTYQHDNRYYRRIFKRHQFQSLPAEEYEVREMFERGARLSNRAINYLSSQGYGNTDDDKFAENNYARQLSMRINRPGRGEWLFPAPHFVTFVSRPARLQISLLDT